MKITDFEGLPDIPCEVTDAVNKAFKKYIFLETVRRGYRRYTCTNCHQSFEDNDLDGRTQTSQMWELSRARHNDMAKCPFCGSTAQVKNVKCCAVSRLYEIICRAIIIPVSHDDVWIRGVAYRRDYYYNNENEKLFKSDLCGYTTYLDTNIYHLQPGKAEHWKYFFNHEQLHEHHIEEPFRWWHGLFTEHFPYESVCVPGWSIKDTFLRYNGMDTPAFSHTASDSPVRYICHYAIHPQLEMLLKLGHTDTVNAVVYHDETKMFHWDARTPWELYGIDHATYNNWQEYHFSLRLLKIYKRLKGTKKEDFELANELDKQFCRTKDVYHFIAVCRRYKKTPCEVFRYIKKVRENSGGSCWHCPGITLREAVTLWGDYIALAEKLGMGKSISPMPKDLKAEHDKLLAKSNKERDKQNRRRLEKQRAALREQAGKLALELTEKYKKIDRFYADIAEQYAYRGTKYTVVVPTGMADILADGMELGHCVGSAYDRYLERIRSGESFLLFLRHTKSPGVPYYTLEVEPGGTVRQKRTYNDTQDRHIKEIVAFLAEWQTVVTSRMTEEDKAAAAESRKKRQEGFEELRRIKTVVNNGHLRGKLLADVLEADLLEVGFENIKKPKREKRKAV